MIEMARNNLFISIAFLLAIGNSYAQRDQTFFRKDYAYKEATQSFYKMHTIYKTWADAQRICELEAASLFYPEDEKEANVVLEFWNKTQPFGHIYIGVSSSIVKGVFETIDGQSILDVYSNWAPGEPNDANGQEDCVLMRRDGTLNDVNCNGRNPFVCKKTLDSLEWNSFCNMPYLDYLYEGSLGKCYKLHLESATWQEAYAACAYEQSYLAIINSQAEADRLVKLTGRAPRDEADGEQPSVHVGFHKRPKGWTTIKGTKLQDSGYAKWGDQQPDNHGGEEKCGAMFYDGLLNDVACTRRSLFVCEHDVSFLGNSINERNNDE